MWVQEIEFDIDKGEQLSQGGFNEVKDVPLAQLRLAAEQEFGSYFGDLFDPDDKTKRVGWKFRAKAKYDDPEVGNEFNLETWVILHEAPPKMEYSYYVIQDHELEALEKVNELLGTQDDVEDTSIDNEAVVIPDEAFNKTLEESVESLIKESMKSDSEPELLDDE